ncbi:MAG: RsmD family RNA methyltransferase [Bdellovibrionales bacterium]|nr:RsmD family RNA methyltransferase [Bdellovibrionales bacterium]
MIKILGGVARGFPLATPRSDSTRPTSVLIKRKLFDWRQNMEGYQFIDLCAGSGAVAFEALSRGAEKVAVNDSMRGAFLTLKENQEGLIRAFKFDPASIVVSSTDAKLWVQKELRYQFPDTKDVILFLDPPFEAHKLYFEILESLKASNFEGEVWVESDRLIGPKLADVTGAFHSVIKTVEQGDHFVVVGKLI